jgi:hypothetical protein
MTASKGHKICERVAKALAARHVREEIWACGRLADDRYCLLADGQRWKVGLFERGTFDVRYETEDSESAVSYFVEWVSRMDRAEREGVEATKAWLESQGLKKP